MNRSDAVRLLKRRLGEMGAGQFRGPEMERTTFEDLVTIIEQEYRANGRKSLGRMQTALKPLRLTFGTSLVRDITYDRLNTYVADRLAGEIAPASVRYELCVLRRAFRLAQRAGKAVCPTIPTVAVQNTRTGFFERDDFFAVRAHLPADLRPVITFAYCTGWRTLSEILPLQWRQVDVEAGMVRLEPGTTKNDEGRTFPFAALPELARLFREQDRRTRELELTTGHSIPWVFHRHGYPILDTKWFYAAWKEACRKAGVPGRIPHDFRRTAVRNFERAGVPRSVAMKLTGHKTESVYRRYAIVSEADLLEGLKKLATLQAWEHEQREQRKGQLDQRTPTIPLQFHEDRAGRATAGTMEPLEESYVIGAGGRDRTGMSLLSPRDFKSLASANFATPAAGAAVAGL